MAYHCSKCNSDIEKKVYGYSKKEFGEVKGVAKEKVIREKPKPKKKFYPYKRRRF